MRLFVVPALAGPPEGGTTNSGAVSSSNLCSAEYYLRKQERPIEILEPGFFQAKLREYEARLIREVLQRAHGNQARAARILGLPPPDTRFPVATPRH